MTKDDRLTMRDTLGHSYCSQCMCINEGVVGGDCPELCVNILIDVLAAYEDTGLTPEDIERLKTERDRRPPFSKPQYAINVDEAIDLLYELRQRGRLSQHEYNTLIDAIHLLMNNDEHEARAEKAKQKRGYWEDLANTIVEECYEWQERALKEKKERNSLKAEYRRIQREAAAMQYGRDQWKARAEALERAIRHGGLGTGKCNLCKFGIGKIGDPKCQCKNFDKWEFDIARFSIGTRMGYEPREDDKG